MLKIRFTAFAVHLGLSCLIVGLALGLIVGLWYPFPMPQIQGLKPILLMLIAVDLVLGPCLTFIVYKPGKPSLKFDLVIIALVQVSALTYGVYSTFIARPVYNVFYGDRFEVVSATEYPADSLSRAKGSLYVKFPASGPLWVGAIMPEDSKEKERVMFSAVAGGGLKLEPQYYVAFEKVKQRVLNNGKRASDLLSANLETTLGTAPRRVKHATPEQMEALRTWLSTYKLAADKIILLPLKGSSAYATAALNQETGEILGAKALDPWWYQ